jgi:hypothetical protein
MGHTSSSAAISTSLIHMLSRILTLHEAAEDAEGRDNEYRALPPVCALAIIAICPGRRTASSNQHFFNQMWLYR